MSKHLTIFCIIYSNRRIAVHKVNQAGKFSLNKSIEPIIRFFFEICVLTLLLENWVMTMELNLISILVSWLCYHQTVYYNLEFDKKNGILPPPDEMKWPSLLTKSFGGIWQAKLLFVFGFRHGNAGLQRHFYGTTLRIMLCRQA